MDFPNSEQKWGDKHVLFNEAVNCWNYIATMADDLRTSTEHRWNDTDGGKSEVLGKNHVPLPHWPHKKKTKGTGMSSQYLLYSEGGESDDDR